MELDKYIEAMLIEEIRGSGNWRQLGQPIHDRIKDPGVKCYIKSVFPKTNIKKWKKEYAKYMHIADGSFVEIHRFVNCNCKTEEIDVKIKRNSINEEVLKLIAAASALRGKPGNDK